MEYDRRTKTIRSLILHESSRALINLNIAFPDREHCVPTRNDADQIMIDVRPILDLRRRLQWRTEALDV